MKTRIAFPACIMALMPFAVCGQFVNSNLSRPDLTGNIETAVSDSTATVDSQPVLFLPDLTGEIYTTPVNKSLCPRVFKGYRNLMHPRRYAIFPDPQVVSDVWRDSVVSNQVVRDITADEGFDELSGMAIPGLEEQQDTIIEVDDLEPEIPSREELPVAFGSVLPDWLRNSLDTYRLQEDFVYQYMLDNPSSIEYAYWDLPEPPRLPEEDYSFRGFLKRLDLPEVKMSEHLPVHANGGRINWLHTFNIALQLSQAYVSGNWYQGGNSYLAFLGNFLWDVQLNPVYHPKTMFQSTVSYKLAINSTPDDEYHRYSVSQDLFQYNLKAGYKAIYNWYYSFLAQFKTQFMPSYPANSMTRSASFLSPGELNLGLGMTYSKENAAKTLKFSASISPVSYNLKTCIDPKVDHAQFGIKPDRKWVNEIGSNAEVNFYAKLWGNTTYTTRLFLFSDYKLFQTDWENTLNFQFSRLFSTQVYAHLRYDTSADSKVDRGWRKLMLKEILSVGISYTFSTK